MSDQRHFIKEWRIHRGLTQQQMADRVGIDKSYLSKIENGKKRYDQPFLEAAAEVLNCEVADLIQRDPNDSEAIWALWDKMQPVQKAQLVEIAKTLRKVS